MHPANDPRRRWDGSATRSHHSRALRVAATSPTRLLRTAQPNACRHCGNRIEWYPRPEHQRPVALHPHELAAAAVPARCRWHVSAGIAHRAGDGSAWCRIPHHLLCPAREADPPAPGLAEPRRQLALRTRRLIDTGAFTPPAVHAPQPSHADHRPARPVVQILGIRYLAHHPLEDIRCVCQTRRRTRCPHPVLAPVQPTGTWALQPAAATTCRGQLALPDTVIAVYDLTALPYSEQLRWRAQRCPAHAATSGAADLAVADWEPFDPLAHHEHIHSRLPDHIRPPRPAGPCTHP
ncbi:DUF6083 domain-containing protein [Streptomyces sp. NPDC051976]|uniref:DUF6083 domain-containing protein n=1 Tax=Streptomyces sp. NPDC051976 TaxID=3154947 RepID=UPI00342099ED